VDCEAVILGLTTFSVEAPTMAAHLEWMNPGQDLDALSSLANLFCLVALFSHSFSSVRPLVIAVTAQVLACHILERRGRRMEVMAMISDSEIREGVGLIQRTSLRVMQSEDGPLHERFQV
jgi:hypothetical protein